MLVSMTLSETVGTWLHMVAGLDLAVLPATLLWLVVVCLLKHALSLLNMWKQLILIIFLGGLSGLYCAWLLDFAHIFVRLYVVSGFISGAFLATIITTFLVLRSKILGPMNTQAKLLTLQNTIRPHFFFNTINSAIALIETYPDKAQTLLEDLSELFRQVMTQSDKPSTLTDEIALAKTYLAIEEMRFGDRLRVTWDVDETLGGIEIPALSIQPLVENAIVHGVEPSVEGVDIAISLTQSRGFAILKISNTYFAKASNKGAGIGLKNIRERIALMHDLRSRFHVNTNDHGKFTVTIEIQR